MTDIFTDRMDALVAEIEHQLKSDEFELFLAKRTLESDYLPEMVETDMSGTTDPLFVEVHKSAWDEPEPEKPDTPPMRRKHGRFGCTADNSPGDTTFADDAPEYSPDDPDFAAAYEAMLDRVLRESDIPPEATWDDMDETFLGFWDTTREQDDPDA